MKIKANNISIRIGEIDILNRVSFDIPEKSFACILGSNGSGKSTLLHAISQNIKNYSGDITTLNTSEVSFLPQNLIPPLFLSLMDVVYLGLYHRGLDNEHKLREVEKLLDTCGINSIRTRSFTEASEGEQQRAWIAFALAQSKDVMLLDEPFSSIDLSSKKSFYELLQKTSQSGKTIMLVTHDIEMAIAHSDWIVRLDNGEKTFEGDPASYKKVFNAKSNLSDFS